MTELQIARSAFTGIILMNCKFMTINCGVYAVPLGGTRKAIVYLVSNYSQRSFQPDKCTVACFCASMNTKKLLLCSHTLECIFKVVRPYYVSIELQERYIAFSI